MQHTSLTCEVPRLKCDVVVHQVTHSGKRNLYFRFYLLSFTDTDCRNVVGNFAQVHFVWEVAVKARRKR